MKKATNNHLLVALFLLIATILLAEFRFQELPVEPGDVVHGNTFRAFHFAGTGIRAVTESQFVHLGNHGARPAGSFRTALRQEGQRADAGSHKQHGRTVLASCYASSAADAGSCIHALLGIFVCNQDIVGILSRAGPHRDETAGLKDLIESSAIHDQVFDDRET